MELKNYPKELTEKREMIECNFIFALYKNPELIDDYKNIQNMVDIITEDGVFYYGIALNLHKLGYQAFDNITLVTFLKDKPELSRGFEERGGYATIQSIISLINEDNIDIYYDELVKSNMLLNLYLDGFNVMSELNTLKDMSSEELYDYYDYKLNNICVGKIEKIKPENLSTGYGSYIAEWNKGNSIGFKIGAPALNYRLAGVHKKNLLLHLAHIGNGKTTSAIWLYVLPAIAEGDNVCIIANEQSIDEWRQMILATVLFNRINYKGMNRQKLLRGNFSEEDIKHMNLAAEWLEKQPGKILFFEMNDYGIGNIQKIIKKYSKLENTEYFIVDTLKPINENSDRSWADFSEVAKTLFSLSKSQNVAILCTCQLSSESMGRRFLDLSCIGKSRAIAETATSVVMFRTMTADEKEKLKPYEWKGKTKYTYDLDLDKDYIIVFTPKNRYGATNPQLVIERNMDFNSYKQIGSVDIQFDGFRAK